MLHRPALILALFVSGCTHDLDGVLPPCSSASECRGGRCVAGRCTTAGDAAASDKGVADVRRTDARWKDLWSGTDKGCTKTSDCDDKLTCTADFCNNGSCFHSVYPGICKIGGSCHNNNEANPANKCQHCDAKQNPSGWTSNPTCNLPCCSSKVCAGALSCKLDPALKKCNVVGGSFTPPRPSPSDWAINAPAYHDAAGWVVLTPMAGGKLGSLWYKPVVTTCGVQVKFKLRLTKGNHYADGVALYFQDGTDSTLIGPDLGLGVPGLAVIFKIWIPAWSTPADPIKIMSASKVITGCQGTKKVSYTGSWNDLEVRIDAGTAVVRVNGVEYLQCDVSKHLPSKAGMIGIVGKTGADYAKHEVDDVIIDRPCGGKKDGLCK